MTSAVDELYGTLKFARKFNASIHPYKSLLTFILTTITKCTTLTADAVSQTSETLRAFHGKADMPAFGVVENLVEEEVYVPVYLNKVNMGPGGGW